MGVEVEPVGHIAKAPVAVPSGVVRLGQVGEPDRERAQPTRSDPSVLTHNSVEGTEDAFGSDGPSERWSTRPR